MKIAHIIRPLFVILWIVLLSSILSQQAHATLSLDPTYGNNGFALTQFSGSDTEMLVQSDNKTILLGRQFTGTDLEWTLIRYNTSGTLDTSFGNGGIVTKDFGHDATLYAGAVQPDGKIVVGGNVIGTCSNNHCWTLARYNTDGSLDTTFGNNGIVTTSLGDASVVGTTIQPDGKIIAVGSNGSIIIVRYNTNGSIDPGFGEVIINNSLLQNSGPGPSESKSATIQPDGKIVVMASDGGNGHLYVIRLNTDGSFDNTFANAGIFTSSVTGGQAIGSDDLALQPDGKIILAGTEYTLPPIFPNNASSTFIGRLNANGTFDSSFGNGAFVVNSFSGSPVAYSPLVLSNGKILLAGRDAVQGSNTYTSALWRYNANGTLDTTFGNNGTFLTSAAGNSSFIRIAFQTDGKLLGGGSVLDGSNVDWSVFRYTGLIDNQPPTINTIPNSTVDEGDTYSVSSSFSDTDSSSWTATVDYGDGSGVQPLSLNPDKTFSLSHLYKDEGIYTVTVKVTDNQGATGTGTATITVNNAPFTVSSITAPTTPTQIGNAITASAAYSDPGVLDTHTASWNWGDGNTTTGTVTESNGSGTVSNSHTYTTDGVYTVTLTVTDDDGVSQTSTFQYIVIFDPSAGFVTGGGTITSPAGAYTQNPSLTGKANFGFVCKYQNGATIPSGNTEFQFQTASFNFHSTSYDWLVVGGAKAQYKGSGTINGTGDYQFILTAIDGEIPGGGGQDKFRIKIMDKTTGATIYDNQIGSSDTSDPTTALDSGDIVIHK